MDLAIAMDHGPESHWYRCRRRRRPTSSTFTLDRIADREEGGLPPLLEPRARPQPNCGSAPTSPDSPSSSKPHWRSSGSHAAVECRGRSRRCNRRSTGTLFQLHQASAQIFGTGIPAKGLTGQAYEGHYFWDTDVFVLPFLAHHSPRAAAELIRFRHALLPAARRRAKELSHVGALYPWRTINGEEASAYYEAGTAQYHIDAAVVYGIDSYVKATGDEELLWDCGVEIAAETARFWADLGFFEKSDRAHESFHIHMCTGPDEYSALVDDNAYTNYMARFNLLTAAAWARRMAAEQPARYQPLADQIGLRPIRDRRLGRGRGGNGASDRPGLGDHPPGRPVSRARSLELGHTRRPVSTSSELPSTGHLPASGSQAGRRRDGDVPPARCIFG